MTWKKFERVVQNFRRRLRVRQFSRLRLESERRMRVRFEEAAARNLLVFSTPRARQSDAADK